MMQKSLPQVLKNRASLKRFSNSQKTKNGKDSSYSTDFDDLPISTEMIGMMESTLYDTDEHGVLRDTVGSHLSQPLTSSSLFYPLASIMSSTFSAAKSPDRYHATRTSNSAGTNIFGTNNTNQSFEFNKSIASNDFKSSEFQDILFTSESQLSPSYQPSQSRLFTSDSNQLSQNVGTTTSNQEDKSAISDYNTRLNILWLKRKAELERQDGNLDAAVQSLQQAVQEHLGPGISSNNYEAANLSQPTMTSDPKELLQNIEEKFFIYEPNIHSYADRIQRWYRRLHKRKCHLITSLARCMRGFLARRKINRWKNIRKQCAILLQRRFRTHLKRMNRLATLLKQWYKIRKFVKEYRKKLHLYQMARRVQALYRGIIGRRVAAYYRLRHQSAAAIQRQIRKYFVLTERYYVISQFHKRFFLAARKIQRFVRQRQAIERARLKVLIELLREQLRQKKEEIIIQELLRIERMKFHFYLETSFGKMQTEWHQHCIQCKEDVMILNKQSEEEQQQNKEIIATKKGKKRPGSANSDEGSSSRKSNKSGKSGKSKKKSSSGKGNDDFVPDKLSFVTPQIITVIDLFDEHDDGRVPWYKLPSLLSQLSISGTEALLEKLKDILDPEDNGFFYLTHFLQWYDSDAADDYIPPPSLPKGEGDEETKTQWWRELWDSYMSLEAKQERKTRQKLLQDEMLNKFYRRYFMALIRQKFPPKFSCCQCMQTFALFTDYYTHYDYEIVEISFERTKQVVLTEADKVEARKQALEQQLQAIADPHGAAKQAEEAAAKLAAEGPKQPELERITENRLVGKCRVVSKRAMYYPAYWEKYSWKYQCEVAHEISRINDQFAFVKFHTKRAMMEEVTMWQNTSVLKQFYQQLTPRIEEWLIPQFQELSMRDFIQLYLNLLMKFIFEVPGLNRISDIFLRLFGKIFQFSIQKEWIVNEGIDKETFQKTCKTALQDMLSDIMDPRKRKPDEGSSKKKKDQSIADYASNENAFKTTKKQKMKKKKANQKKKKGGKADVSPDYTEEINYYGKTSDGAIGSSYTGQKKKYSAALRLLAEMMLRILRLHLVEAESSVLAMLQYRGQFPRKLNLVTEDMLLQCDLIALTSKQFATDFNAHLVNYDKIRDEFEILRNCPLPVVKTCSQFFTGLFRRSDAQIVNSSVPESSLASPEENQESGDNFVEGDVNTSTKRPGETTASIIAAKKKQKQSLILQMQQLDEHSFVEARFAVIEKMALGKALLRQVSTWLDIALKYPHWQEIAELAVLLQDIPEQVSPGNSLPDVALAVSMAMYRVFIKYMYLQEETTSDTGPALTTGNGRVVTSNTPKMSRRPSIRALVSSSNTDSTPGFLSFGQLDALDLDLILVREFRHVLRIDLQKDKYADKLDPEKAGSFTIQALKELVVETMKKHPKRVKGKLGGLRAVMIRIDGFLSWIRGGSVYFKDARDIQLIQARHRQRLVIRLLHHLPRNEDQQSELWKQYQNYYHTTAHHTLLYSSNTTSMNDLDDTEQWQMWSSAQRAAGLPLYNHLHHYIGRDEKQLHRQILEALQREAEVRTWYNIRLRGRGRKAVRVESMMVGCMDEIATAMLSTITHKDANVKQATANNSTKSRYAQRLLAIVGECFLRLLDTTCQGALDSWEERQLRNSLLMSSPVASSLHFFSRALANCLPATASSSHNTVYSVDSPSPAIFKTESSKKLNTNTSSMKLLEEDDEEENNKRMKISFEEAVGKWLIHKAPTRGVNAIAKDLFTALSWCVSSRQDMMALQHASKGTWARVMLSAVQRRLARQLTEQTLFLSNPDAKSFVRMVNHQDTIKDTDSDAVLVDVVVLSASNERERSLVVRSQVLALRQVKLFLRTTLGKHYWHREVSREIEKLWNDELLLTFPPLHTMRKNFNHLYGVDVDNNNYGLPPSAAVIRDSIQVDSRQYPKHYTSNQSRHVTVSYEQFVKYMFLVHCEAQHAHHVEMPMMLNTELGHLIHSIRINQPSWQIDANASISVIKALRKTINKEEIKWMIWSEVWTLLAPLFTNVAVNIDASKAQTNVEEVPVATGAKSSKDLLARSSKLTSGSSQKMPTTSSKAVSFKGNNASTRAAATSFGGGGTSASFKTSKKLLAAAATASHAIKDQTAKVKLNYKNLHYFAWLRIKSRARQQAVLISMNSQDISVAETNYRCSVLGLYRVAKYVDISQEMKQNKATPEELIPRELLTLYLMSLGYDERDVFMHSYDYQQRIHTTFSYDEDIHGVNANQQMDDDDLTISSNGLQGSPSGRKTYQPLLQDQADATPNPSSLDNQAFGKSRSDAEAKEQKKQSFFAGFGSGVLEKFMPILHQVGKIDKTHFLSTEVKFICQQHIWQHLTYYEATKRRLAYTAMASFAHMERLKLQKAITLQLNDVEKKGSIFLRELITGVSFNAHQ